MKIPWPHPRSHPWPTESEICSRRKFYHVFHMNQMINHTYESLAKDRAHESILLFLCPEQILITLPTEPSWRLSILLQVELQAATTSRWELAHKLTPVCYPPVRIKQPTHILCSVAPLAQLLENSSLDMLLGLQNLFQIPDFLWASQKPCEVRWARTTTDLRGEETGCHEALSCPGEELMKRKDQKKKKNLILISCLPNQHSSF